VASSQGFITISQGEDIAKIPMLIEGNTDEYQRIGLPVIELRAIGR
jgi:hypothetical protein